MRERPYRVAAVATHPIQYQIPLWRAIAASDCLDIKVFFASRHGLDSSLDPGFGKTFAWDIPLLEGYDHEFLPSYPLRVFKGPVANRFPRGLAKKLREGGYDAVLVNGYATGAAWAGMLAAWRTRTPLIMRGDTHEHGRSAFAIRQQVKRALLPMLLRRVDGFLAIGTWNAEYWSCYGVPPAKIQTSLFAVDNDFFRAKAREQEPKVRDLRAKWGASSEDVAFLYCAKLIPAKAPEILLRAFALLSEEKSHLVFVGSGVMETTLRETEKELQLGRVHWEGFVNQTSLPAYYRGADVLVLPSRDESWGLVVNEAMACGTPCIVSDVVGSGPDMVEARATGLVFRHDDAEDLKEAMGRACFRDNRLRWAENIPTIMSRASYGENVRALCDMIAKIKRKRGLLSGGERSKR